MEYDPSNSTWEPEVHIPGFIKYYYSDPKKIGTELPKPVIKQQKTLMLDTLFSSWEGMALKEMKGNGNLCKICLRNDSFSAFEGLMVS